MCKHLLLLFAFTITIGIDVPLISAQEYHSETQTTIDNAKTKSKKIVNKIIPQNIVIIPLLNNYATLSTLIAKQIENSIIEAELPEIEVNRILGVGLAKDELGTILDEYFIDVGYNTILFIDLEAKEVSVDLAQNKNENEITSSQVFTVSLIIYRTGQRTPSEYYTTTIKLVDIKNVSLEKVDRLESIEELAKVVDVIAESQDKVLYSVIYINPLEDTRPNYVLKSTSEHIMYTNPDKGEIYVPLGEQAITVYQVVEDEEHIIGTFEMHFSEPHYTVTVPFIDAKQENTIKNTQRQIKPSFLDYLNSVDFDMGYQYPIYSGYSNVFFPTTIYGLDFKYSLQKLLFPLYLGVSSNFVKVTPEATSSFDVFQIGLFGVVGGVFTIAKNTELNIGIGGGIVFFSQTNITEDILNTQVFMPSFRTDVGLAYHIPIENVGSLRIFLNTDIATSFTEIREEVNAVEAKAGKTGEIITVIHIAGSTSLGLGWRF